MRCAPVIKLSAEERTILERTVRSTRSAVRDVFRARMLLLAAQGRANHEIAAALTTGEDTVSKWRRRFAVHRCEGLKDEPGRGRKRQYTDKAIERIVEQTLYHTPGHATHWSTRTMAEHAGVSHTTVGRIWNAHELKPHLVRTFKLSRDKQFIGKLRDVIGLYLDPPEHALVYCLDEKSQIQALDRTQPGLPMKQGRAGTMTHDYKRHGTTSLFAALHVLEGTIIGACMKRHRHQEYLRFLREIDRQTPHGLAVHLICDNYSTHKQARVNAWLERHPRFHVHFIPTSASWLNLVERFFREITTKQIRRGVFRSVQELTHAIDAFLTHYNEHPKPFVWTKTADQILEKLAPLYENRG